MTRYTYTLCMCTHSHIHTQHIQVPNVWNKDRMKKNSIHIFVVVACSFVRSLRSALFFIFGLVCCFTSWFSSFCSVRTARAHTFSVYTCHIHTLRVFIDWNECLWWYFSNRYCLPLLSRPLLRLLSIFCCCCCSFYTVAFLLYGYFSHSNRTYVLYDAARAWMCTSHAKCSWLCVNG